MKEFSFFAAAQRWPKVKEKWLSTASKSWRQ
jgi:hypothetical protein